MPKPALPPHGQRKGHLLSATITLSSAAAIIVIVTAAVVKSPEPSRGLELSHQPKVEFIDFTGKLRYGKDKSTGFCFANIRTADNDPRLWRTFARVPCEALERLK